MKQDIEFWRARVNEVMPDQHFAEIELNQDGLVNDVVIVNGEFVFRFAKTEHDADTLAREVTILDLVRPRLNVSIPKPIHYERGCMVYPYLRGQPLLRETVLALDELEQTSIADTLGMLLYALHTSPLSEPGQEVKPTIAPASREQNIYIRARVREKLYPLLLPHQIQWAEALYEGALATEDFFDYEPVLVHADLAPYHILFDERGRGSDEHNRMITGILDFGTAGVGDAAQDFGTLLSAYGEQFVVKMGATYPGLNQLLPRARFHAQAIELQWALNGIESGENFWFTAHLGGARDIRS